MRITDLKCGYVRGSLFVKLHTNQGIWGCGEAVDAVGGTYYMVQNFGRQLRNQSPLNVNALAERIRKGGVFGGAQSGMYVAVSQRGGNGALGLWRGRPWECAGVPVARRKVPRPDPCVL